MKQEANMKQETNTEEQTDTKTDEWFRARAKELYHRDGQIEVDSNARISYGDDEGAYVEAWVWVPFNEEKSDS